MKRIIIVIIAVFYGFYVEAQTSGRVHFGDALHMSYDFDKAKAVYTEILDNLDMKADSILVEELREKIVHAENGRNMSRFVQKPTVIARRKFSIKDFFLYYPLEDKSWRSVPNILDTIPERGFVHGLYAPEWDDRIYYSGVGDSGNRDIMMTELADTAWSVPVVDSTLSSSVSDEIFPLLSPDGNTIYFASKGLYGVGGFDLYRSQWDRKNDAWTTPQNLGFPYSSPADDFLYMETDDGEHILFASNRECRRDSVIVYVIRKEPYPVHAPMSDAAELMALSRLDVPVEEAAEEKDYSDGIPDNELTLRYREKISEVKALRDSISVSMDRLEDMRNEYIMSNDPGVRIRLTNRILELEPELPLIHKALDKANRELRDIEMEFLKEGIFINVDVSDTEEPTEIISADLPQYEFRKMQPGGRLNINLMVPEPDSLYVAPKVDSL